MFPRNHRLYLNMLSEIVFIKGKLNTIGYQEMLHGELLPFITEIEEKKRIFQRDNASVRTIATTKKWFQDFGIGIIIMASIES